MKKKKIIIAFVVFVFIVACISGGVILKQIKEEEKYAQLQNTLLDHGIGQTIEYNCYILRDDNIVYHIEKLDSFLKNVENKVPDEISIVEWKEEEQPILTNLQYTKNKFILAICTTDEEKIEVKEYSASKYTLVKTKEPVEISAFKRSYLVELKETKTGKTIPICNYVEAQKQGKETFEIIFNKDLSKEKVKILDKNESAQYDYDIYSYKGTIDVLMNGEKMSLRQALLDKKITVEQILEKAKKDQEEYKIIWGAAYLDGGSRIYLYNDYQILKCNRLDGNKDFYIGVPTMDINNLIEN